MEVSLKEISKIVTGNTPSKKNKNYWNSKDICFIKPDVIGSGIDSITTSNEYISNSASSKARIVDRNTILITCIGNIGRIGIISDKKVAVNQQINAIIPNYKINIRYLAYVLLFSQPRLNALANSAVVPIVNKTQLGNFKVKINPNLESQGKIVSILDKIAKIIKKQTKEIEHLDELIKARFVEMFGDPVINNKNIKNQKLGDVCFLKAGEFTSSKTISPVKTSINKYPCFGGNGIRGYVNNYTHQGNYSLIGRQGALCGNVKFATGKFRNTEHAILVSPKIEINSRWLFELLNLEKLNRFKSGAAQPGLAVKTLNEVTIPVPGLKLQNEFANFVQQVDKSKFENIVYLNKTLSSKILSQLGDAIRD